MSAPDEVRVVEAGAWVEAVVEALRTHPFLDSLHAVDEVGRPAHDGSEQLRVVCRLVDWDDPSGPAGLQLHTRIPREQPVLASLAAVAPGAVWHEREAHDFYGIEFTGGDARALLVHPSAGVESVRPLLKDVVLAARVTTPWPGAKDPEDGERAQASRRRMSPAGVPDPEVWGAREQGDPASSDELVQALQGGRVRRRR